MLRRTLFFVFVLLAAAARAATYNISVGNFFFSPNDITIQPGDTVNWNFTSGTHSATSTGGESYDSNLLSSGTFSHTFTVVQTNTYVCLAHPSMTGIIRVVPPSPTPTPSPTITVTPTISESFTGSPTFTESPTVTVSPTITDTPNPSDTKTDTPSITPSFTASPSVTLTPTPTATLFVSATVTPTPGSFAGIQDARLVISPIADGRLRLWAHLLGLPEAVQLRVYSAAYNEMLNSELTPGAGDQRWVVDVSSLPPGPIWIQLWVRQRGDWRKGPVLRSYVIK